MELLKVTKHNWIVVPLACVAALAMVFVSEGSYWQAVGTLDELATTDAATTNITDLQGALLDAETGQQGYMLARRREYLQPYSGALAKVDGSLAALEAHYAARPESGAPIVRLRNLVLERMAIMASAIELMDAGKDRAAGEIFLGGTGKQKMDAIRALIAELLARESLTLETQRKKIYYTLMLSRIGMATLSTLSLLALFMYLRQTLMLKRQELELKQAVQLERNRLELEVLQRTAQLTELTHYLQNAREDERSRLARNLHDDLGALLTSAKLDAARIKSRLSGGAPESLELLAHLVGTLNNSVALGRRIIEDLRPSALSNLGLVATLEILAREFAEQSGVQVHCALEPIELRPSAELMVYRLVQEAVTNITKYASATQVWISLGLRDSRIEVAVRDNGIGFDTLAPAKSAYGLMGMRYRVEAEGGVLSLQSSPGQGTEIRMSMPMPQAPRA